MKFNTYSAAMAVCLAFAMLSGCASTEQKPDISNASMGDLVTSTTPATGSTAVLTTPEETSQTTGPEDTTTPAVQIPTAEVTTTPDADNNFDIFYEEVHEQFDLSEEELSFVDYSLFVGDSICSGFAEYGIIPREHVAAKGNLGSRSFFDYTFKFRGKEDQTYEQVLKTSKPRYVLLSMGMNDVNMVYEQTYCENYRKVIQATLDGSNTDVFVAAITPVCSKFCANSVIDSFNDYMRRFIEEEFPERVHFIDFAQYLKNDEGKLRTCLHSGDGVHLGPYCYYIALWEMHRALMETGLWDGTNPTDDAKPMPTYEATVEMTKPSTAADTTASAEPEETIKPQTTKPAKTTKATTSKTTKHKPIKTTTELTETEPIEVEPDEKTVDGTVPDTDMPIETPVEIPVE